MDFLVLKQLNRLDRTKFCTEMEIQHRKLINAKFWQYAHHVSNAHAQHKMVSDNWIAIEF